MNFFYEFTGSLDEETLQILGLVGGVMIVVFAIAAVFGLVLYILRSLALYTIAKRRGLQKAWLAWIPVGREWIIGSVSDQYQYVTQGNVRNMRKLLLILQLVAAVTGTFHSGISVITAASEVLREFSYSYGFNLMLPGLLISVLSLGSSLVGITAFVVRQICMYDLYRSCNPKNAVVFLVLGIIFNVTEPFFLMSCRYKEEGMPPRRRAGEAPAPDTDPDPEPFRDPEPFTYNSVDQEGEEKPFVDVIYNTPVDPE